jgi:hypothetical protein
MRLNSGLFKGLVKVQIFYLRYTRQLIGVAGAKRRSLNVALVWLQLIEQRRSDVRVLDPADIRLQPGRSDEGLLSAGNWVLGLGIYCLLCVCSHSSNVVAEFGIRPVYFFRNGENMKM